MDKSSVGVLRQLIKGIRRQMPETVDWETIRRHLKKAEVSHA